MSTIHKFKILHGTESDNEAFVFENTSGLREIMTTIDGVEKRLTLADVEEKIRETESSLIGLKRAKELLTNT
jgi:hypothetical protein